MKYIILLMSFLAFGCLGSDSGIPIIEPPQQEPVCHTVTEMVPVVIEECGEVAYTEEVCERRELEYNTSMASISHICSLSDEGCGGTNLSNCSSCSKAVTRCTLEITNLDKRKSGEWTVGATFVSGKATFSREPITKTIDPEESQFFDFQQFYDPGAPINSATCKLVVTDVPVVEDCQDVTKTRNDCSNVTKMVEVSKEVCN